ncbi:MAG: Asp23/Gls24 family envelope stress response protein [Clostridiales bacterium]|nr:Asp23/Gls24 family envelope stress response protein [Clostridiales bacterium]
MSENYPSDVKLNENPDGSVTFATEVVATIAGLAATEVEGVASMSSTNTSGLADMFSRKNTRNLTKGVRIDLDSSMVTVDITIVVEYGSPVPDVARSIQENVKKAIETMTGLDVRSVDVHVSGISFEREQRANAELDEQHRKMLEQTNKIEEEVAREVEAEVAAAEPIVEDDLDDLEDDIDDDLEDEIVEEAVETEAEAAEEAVSEEAPEAEEEKAEE